MDSDIYLKECGYFTTMFYTLHTTNVCHFRKITGKTCTDFNLDLIQLPNDERPGSGLKVPSRAAECRPLSFIFFNIILGGDLS